ncbi:MAG: histidine phosphatase family protein [bacterium]|nr:histidine phosphatase family protein [bacterium]
MVRIIFLRHAEAEKKGKDRDKERLLTSHGCKQAQTIQGALKKVNFAPDLVVVSDAGRTAQTAALVVGGFVDTVKLPELRNMGAQEYAAVNAILTALGTETPFMQLLALDKENFWRRHARMVANHLHDVIVEKNARQVLVVGHHYTQNAIGLALLGRDHPLLLGPLFKYAEGFMLDEKGNVTHITNDSP